VEKPELAPSNNCGKTYSLAQCSFFNDWKGSGTFSDSGKTKGAFASKDCNSHARLRVPDSIPPATWI
jgi:hypothetical protein